MILIQQFFFINQKFRHIVGLHVFFLKTNETNHQAVMHTAPVAETTVRRQKQQEEVIGNKNKQERQMLSNVVEV